MRKPTHPLWIVFLLSGGFFVLFLLISGVLFLTKRPDPNQSGRSGIFGEGVVGIIELDGPIFDSKLTLKKLERAAESTAIKAVVMRLNSPGGAVGPSQEIYDAVKIFPKPLAVSMSSVAASGAYYIAAGAKKVYANPGTITGSIGVIMQFTNISKLLEWAKVDLYSIKTGRFKDAGAQYRAMAPEEREVFQEMIDEVLGQFKQAVAEGRKLTPEEVTAVADGRIFSGSQAKRLKLVDELGGIQAAIDWVAAEAKIKGKPEVIYIEKKPRGSMLLDFLMADPSENEESSQMTNGVVSLAQRWLGLNFSLPASTPSVATAAFSPGLYFLWSGSH